MKKFLAFFLVLTMLLSLLTVPAMAAGEPTPIGDQNEAPGATFTTFVKNIAADAKTVTDGNDVTYNVIHNADDFMKIASGNKYILANDIDLTKNGTVTLNGNAISTAQGNFTLDGNGYTVTVKMNNRAAGHGLFGRPANNSTTTIRNIKFEASGVLAENSTGVLFGTTAGHSTGHVYFTNVIVNSNDIKFSAPDSYVLEYEADGTTPKTWKTYGGSIFFAKPRISTTFTNCELTGTFTSTSYTKDAGVAGFVGLADCNQTTTISFVGCKASGNYAFNDARNSANAVFVANVSSASVGISFNNCEVDANITIKGDSSAAFVGWMIFPANVSIANSTLKGSLTADKTRCGGFVGRQGKGVVTFANCTLSGLLEFNGNQSAGFVGFVDANSNDSYATFQNCLSDATVIANNGKTACFLGQNYNNNANYAFTNCKVSGVLYTKENHCGGFVGTAGGYYSTTIKTCTVTFTDCSADVRIYATGLASAYVGSNTGGAPTLKFNNCTNASTVYSSASAGSWVAYVNLAEGSATQTTVTVANDCVTTAQIFSQSLCSEYDIDDKNTYKWSDNATWTRVSPNEVKNGAYAYMLAQAQAAAGVTDPDYVYGQTIGTDAKPVMGGATVYKLPLPQTDPIYSNESIMGNYFIVNPNQDYYHQTADRGEKLDDRVIIPIKEDELLTLSTLQVKVIYTLKDETTKTLTVNQNEWSCFCSVYADGQVAMAPEGYLFLAVTVKNIPKTEWDGESIDVQVTKTEMTNPLTLKFASYNIFQSRYDSVKGEEMSNIARTILENDFDVVGLVEVDKDTGRTGYDVMAKLVEEIKKQSGKDYYYAYFPAIENHWSGGQYGDAVLSKYPIVEEERIMLPTWDGKDRYGKDYEPRVLGRTKIEVNGDYINFFVTHLDHTDLDLVQEQLDYIAETLKAYDNFVLTGDFNTSDFSQYEVIENASMVNNESFYIVTYGHNYVSIDNIVYSSATWKFSIPHVVKDSYSDHYALYATGVFRK